MLLAAGTETYYHSDEFARLVQVPASLLTVAKALAEAERLTDSDHASGRRRVLISP